VQLERLGDAKPAVRERAAAVLAALLAGPAPDQALARAAPAWSHRSWRVRAALAAGAAAAAAAGLASLLSARQRSDLLLEPAARLLNDSHRHCHTPSQKHERGSLCCNMSDGSAVFTALPHACSAVATLL